MVIFRDPFDRFVDTTVEDDQSLVTFEGGTLWASLSEFIDGTGHHHGVEESDRDMVRTAVDYAPDEFVFSAVDETESGERRLLSENFER
jgi:hypothetical protein